MDWKKHNNYLNPRISRKKGYMFTERKIEMYDKMDVGIWAFESLLKKENDQTRIQRLTIISVKRGEFSINWKVYTFKSETQHSTGSFWTITVMSR